MCGNCKIEFSYINLDNTIESFIKSKLDQFNNRAYVLSPLGRIALKYGKITTNLLKELYNEDISITIMSELYNNNIPVVLHDNGSFLVSCKYKNFNSIVSLLSAILNDIFFTIFDESAEIKISCIIKE